MNRSHRDAFLRIHDASQECFVDASPEYLEALRQELFFWIRRIEAEQAAQDRAADRARAAEEA